ncbi:MAG: hypothetical protein WAK89_00275, partial [Candidatus Sulfotelmatobacter sp.]
MRNLLFVSSATTHVATAALARPAAAPRPMWGRALSPVHAAQVYRAAAAPQLLRDAQHKSPHERGRAALQRRVKLGKGTASAVPLKAQK